MKFHNVKMVGPFNNEHLTSLPAFNVAKDQGRMVWLNDGSLWYGETDRWVKILASDNGGNTNHNDLAGRSDNDCHPISAITGLEEALKYAGIRWEMVSSSVSANYPAEKNTGYLVDTTSGSATATFPASASLGDTIKIVDYIGNFNDNEVIVDGNGNHIMGLTENIELDEKYISSTFVYSDATYGWIITDGKVGDCSGSGSGSGQFMWNIITSNENAQASNGYFVNTDSSPITITLPPSPNIGDTIEVVDYSGHANTNNITIERNGNLIDGSTDNEILSVDRSEISLVYSDSNEGWVVTNRVKESGNGGVIKDDMTIYLAPSASNQSPTGVAVGSDITGDGSITKPFFSIKRAMDYLEDYRIKSGVNVIIHGLPGHYYYNDNHDVDVKIINAKFIKVEFDVYNDNYMHKCELTNDAYTITNNTDYDLIEFTVNDIGTGFYQIQAGDYIKITTTHPADADYAVWNGYYEVTAVNTANKKVTIKFKRHYPYATNHNYRVPGSTGTLTGSYIKVAKLPTHIYYKSNVNSNGSYFFKSEYGFGSLQMNISCTNRYYKSFAYIYDGVIHDIMINCNNFNYGLDLINLQANFIQNTNIYMYSTITSCHTGINFKQGNTNIDGLTINCCYTGMWCVDVELRKNELNQARVIISNNHSYGIYIENSNFHGIDNKTAYNAINILFNDIGLQLVNSYYSGGGLFLYYNNIGSFLNVNSMAVFTGSQDSDTVKTKIYNNNTGLFVLHNSTAYIPHCDISWNYGDGIYCGGKSLVIGVWDESPKNEISHNTGDGIKMVDSSNVFIKNTNINNNGSNGIFCGDFSTARCDTGYINSNSNNGVYANNGNVIFIHIQCKYNGNNGAYIYNSRFKTEQGGDISSNYTGINCLIKSIAVIEDSYVANNTNDGLHLDYDCSAYIYNANKHMSGNGGTDVWLAGNSHVEAFNHTAVSTNITKNSAPSYSSGASTGGCYLLETLI